MDKNKLLKKLGEIKDYHYDCYSHTNCKIEEAYNEGAMAAIQKVQVYVVENWEENPIPRKIPLYASKDIIINKLVPYSAIPFYCENEDLLEGSKNLTISKSLEACKVSLYKGEPPLYFSTVFKFDKNIHGLMPIKFECFYEDMFIKIRKGEIIGYVEVEE